MSDGLNPRARAFLRSVEGGDDPTRAARDRVRTKVKAQLAAGIAAGVAALATSQAAASTAVASSAAATATAATATTATTAASVAPAAIATAGSGLAVGKLAAILVIVGAVAGGTTAVVRHAHPVSAPSVPAAATAAVQPLTAPVARHPVVAPVMAPVAAPAVAPDLSPTAAIPSPRSDRASANVAPTPTPVALPVPDQTTPAAPSLDDEVALVRDARAALRSGDAAQALALLDDHDRRFPGGALAEDCAAARIYAFCALGRTDAARTLTSRFLSEHPVSPHAASVRSSCGAAGGTN